MWKNTGEKILKKIIDAPLSLSPLAHTHTIKKIERLLGLPFQISLQIFVGNKENKTIRKIHQWKELETTVLQNAK